MANPDPNRIDVSLGLVDEASLVAIRALTEQLAANARLLGSLQATNPGDYIRGQQRAAESGRAGSVSSGASRGQRDAPERPRADSRSMRQKLADFTQEGGPSRALAQYGVTEREQYLYRKGRGLDTDPHLFALRGAADPDVGDLNGPAGEPGGGASQGMTEPTWRRTLTANPKRWEESQERLRLPQFGELTIQDKLNVGSDFMARMAETRYQRAQNIRDERTGLQYTDDGRVNLSREPQLRPEDINEIEQLNAQSSRIGNAAGYLQMGAEQSGQLITAGREIKRFAGMFQGMSGRGTDLGFERGGLIGIPGTELGFANPASGAAKEGARQSLTSRRLSLQGGISRGQAREITDSLAGYGWSGDEAQGLAFDAVAPLVSKGFNAGDVTSLLDRTMRQGNSSVQEFVKTMSNLQDTAQITNLTLGQTVEQMKEFVDFGTAHGATAQTSLKRGQEISAANGLAPGVNAEIMQSQMFQGIATTRGFLPEQLGNMGSNQFNETWYQAIDLADRATRGYLNREIRDPVTGEITMTGKEAQMAAKAKYLGVSVDVLERSERERKATLASGRVGGRIRQLDTNIKARQSFKKAEYAKYGTDEDTVLHGNWSGINSPEAMRARHARGVKDKVEEAVRKNFGPDGLNNLNKDWRSIRGDLESLAPGERGDTNNEERVRYFEQIRDLEKKSGRDRTGAAMKLLDKRRNSMSGANSDDDVDPDKLSIDLSDEAKRWFKVVKSKDSSQAKRDAQGGGQSTTTKIAKGWMMGHGLSPHLLGLD